jgi:SAM-dependent methyltransferase
MKLAPLFLVSLTAVGMETALTRYFAVASWSDYGYWVISIVMAGFAFSGVFLALAGGLLRRHAAAMMAALPMFLLASGALGYTAVIINPFNPLQLQNPDTYAPQLCNIALYYAALLPFFFAAGLFISLCFVTNAARIGRVYAADLLGAGAGSLLVLALMFWLPPFQLIPALLPALALAAWFVEAHRLRAGLAALAMLAAAELLLALGPQAMVSQYKPIYPPLHTPNARVLAKVEQPGGEFLLLDDFTERVNTDISNDASMLGYRDPPRSYGLYRDGIRIASLPEPGALSSGYAPGALDAGPYALLQHPDVLLIGASGGFRIAEVLALGAHHVTAVAPERVMYAALRHGLGGSPAVALDARATLSAENPRAAVLSGRSYDIIDMSADFMDAAPANVTAVSAEAFAADLKALRPGGILSIPVSIQDFPAYALRMMSTARAALALNGVDDPARYVIVYRSAWNARILVSPTPFSPAAIAAIAKWCNDRSFDVSYYNGLDVVEARANLYNDLPAVSFDAGTITSTGDDDSLADEAAGIMAGQPTVSSQAFDLRPVTDDRPAFYAILRLNQLSLLLARLQILPQPEIGALVNLAVLAQAGIIAALLLLAPLAAPQGRRAGQSGVLRPGIYFSVLALGFLFIEIFGIERASAFLDDRAAGFSIVLSTMLIFSGLGSFISSRLGAAAEQTVWLAFGVVLMWGGLMFCLSTPVLLGAGNLPYALRIALVVLVMAPVSLAMGLPFPLGLAQVDQKFFLPWAWGLNGAFSVVATPLANLLLRNIGLAAVLGGAVLLYGIAATSFPAYGRERFWFFALKKSAAVDS